MVGGPVPEGRIEWLDAPVTCVNPAASYVYSVEGRRVKRTVGATTWYAHDGGSVLSEFSNPAQGSGTWQKDYIYLNGALLATESPTEGTRFHFSDHLGTPRVITDGTVRPMYNRQQTMSLSSYGAPGMTGVGYEVNRSGGIIAWPEATTNYYRGDHLGSSRMMSSYHGYPVWQATYLPFGQEWNPQSTVNHYKFTGKERDTESGLDYFGARYYSSAHGRFLSPDEFAGGPVDAFSSSDPLPPGPLPYADITDPQSLNKYAYAYNNPLSFVDPNGHCPECVGAILGAGGGAAVILYKTYKATQGEGPIPDNKEIARTLLVGAAIGATLGNVYREANEGDSGRQDEPQQPGDSPQPRSSEPYDRQWQLVGTEKIQ